MKRLFYAPGALGAGLLSAQIIAILHVYASNQKLLTAFETIHRCGYLSVPNLHIARHLESLPIAIAGGLFFTLSIGAGLSLLTMVLVWLWARILNRGKGFALLGACPWVTILVLINSNGWNVYATAYLAVVPPVTALCACRLLPADKETISWSGVLCPAAAAIVLTLSWSTILDKDLFTNVRDHLLLNNPLGKAITNAYYDYTLYPAEAFKSLHQKQIRTSRMGNGIPGDQRVRLEKTLRMRDYLPVQEYAPADLVVEPSEDGKGFQFLHLQKKVLHCPPKEFYLDPGKILKSFSESSDRNATFRKITLIGLLLGLPLTLFALFFSLFQIVPGCFLPAVQTHIIAGLFCVGIGIALLAPVYQGQRAMSTTVMSAENLNSPSTQIRLAALKQACRKGLDISTEARREGIDRSPNTAERYWFVRNLVYSKNRGTSAELISFVNDPEPIVACQALWAMGRRKDRSVIPKIIDAIETSSHWYLQMYGYRALKALGWVQPRSPQNF